MKGGCVVPGMVGVYIALTPADEEELGLSVDVVVPKRKDKKKNG